MRIEVRLAASDDVPFLENVERSASDAFCILSDYVPSNRTVPPEILAEMISNKKLWVAVTDENEPIGFIGVRDMDNLFYIHEISVAHAFQKQGIGRRLILAALGEAKRAGYPAAGLTTRRDAAWNMPFYKSLDFAEIKDNKEWPELWGQLQKEIAEGVSPFIRCAMVKSFARRKVGA